MLAILEPNDTFRYLWESVGQTPTSIAYTIVDGTETPILSGILAESEPGKWFVDVTVPATKGYYTIRSSAIIAGRTYNRSTMFKVIRTEVD